MESVDIKDISGNLLLTTIINEGCKRKFTLMKEDYILLKFSLDNPIYFKLGSYVECDFGRFEVVDLQKPTFNTNTAGYDYELQLDAYYWKWKNKIFKYTPETAGQEASWNLTASLDVQAGIVLRNLKALGYTYNGQDFDFSIDSTVENKSQLMSYDNINILDACFEMAKKWDCECWVTENIIHFGRCEFGDPVDFEIGVNVGEMTRSDSQSTYATRIYAFGSTRNIPSNYRPVDETVVVNGVVQKRLMLPVGTPYIDAYPNMNTEEAVEQVVVFDDIYPRRTGTISDVITHEYTDTIENDDGTTTSEKWNAYRFKDAGITFSEEYVLAGEELKITFQSGKLNGMTFAVTFNPCDKEGGETAVPEKNEDGTWNPDAQVWEIVRNEDYGRKLPGDVLVPANGDSYVLSGWDSTKISELGLVSAAEQELKTETEKYASKSKIDPNTYDCTMRSNHVYDETGLHNLYELGQKVNLLNKAYFENGRQSRIIGFEYNLDYPFDSPVYTVGETAAYSRIGEIEEKIESITLAGQTYTGGGGSGVYLIRRNDSTPATDSNVFSALRSLAEFINKKKPDTATEIITFLKGLEAGIYKAGLSGASIDKDGNAELGSLLTRLRAILAELQVNGPAEFRGNLSSEEFISGFVGGKGWAIMKQEILNALGIPEAKYTAEFDNVIVRGTLRVFEMVISQLLGENDNRIFTAMMEVDHYDPSTGRVYLDTQNGKLYNPFRKDDYIIVQQYNGMPSAENNYYVTKNYELIITEAGCGGLSDGENRLDWVTFKNFTCSMEGGSTALITKGDTFVRVDNATDPERKGIMQIMTVGNTTPYLDVIYGMKTDPDNYLKGRLGNLAGIKHHLFGWLQGFGELLTNLYAIGDFRMRQTGEDIDTKIEMLKGSFSTSYKKLAYDITEEDNYLANATFTEDMAHWTAADNVRFVTVADDALVINRSTVVLKDNFALIEEYDGVDMLHICNSEIRQLNADIRKPGTHKEYKPAAGDTTTEEYVEVKDTLYLSIKFLARTSGTLTAGFQGADTSGVNSLPLSTTAVNSSYDRQTIQVSGTWDGKGDFVLKYTGDMYVSLLAVTDKALDDYKKEVSTAIEQTAGNIRITGKNINNLKNTVTDLGLDLDAAKERITLYANKLDTLTGTVTNLGLSLDATNERITLYANKLDTVQGTITNLGIRMDAAEERITLYATKVGNNESAISALQIKADSITSTVSSVQGDLEQAKKTAAAASQAAMDKATQGVSDANDAWWKAYYAQQDADSAQSTADSAYSKAVSNATAIAQTDSAVSVLAGRFKSDGTLVNTGGCWLLPTEQNCTVRFTISTASWPRRLRSVPPCSIIQARGR